MQLASKAPITGAVFPNVSQNTKYGIAESNAMTWSITDIPEASSIVSLRLVLGS
ncbi:hypothetical protein HDU98_002007, partial [Podochytrium sp. JEL0797]